MSKRQRKKLKHKQMMEQMRLAHQESPRALSAVQSLLLTRRRLISRGIPLRCTDVVACSLDAWNDEMRSIAGEPFDDVTDRFADGVPDTTLVQPELTPQADVNLLSRRD